MYWTIRGTSLSKASGSLSSMSVFKGVAGIESFSGTAWNAYLEPSATTGLTIVIFKRTHGGTELLGCLVKAVNVIRLLLDMLRSKDMEVFQYLPT